MGSLKQTSSGLGLVTMVLTMKLKRNTRHPPHRVARHGVR